MAVLICPAMVEDKTVEASGVAVVGGDLSSSSAAAHSSTTKKGRGRPPKAGGKTEDTGASSFKLSNLMMQLRKISNHPVFVAGGRKNGQGDEGGGLSEQ